MTSLLCVSQTKGKDKIVLMANTLAYYGTELITTVLSFVMLTPEQKKAR